MPEENDRDEEHGETDDGNKPDDGVTRLLDIITQEVSIVTRGANKRTWLVRKGIDEMKHGEEVTCKSDGSLTTNPGEGDDDGDKIEKQMMIQPNIKAAVMSMLERLSERASKLIDGLKSAKESDGESGMPAPVAAEFSALGTGLRAILSRFPAKAEKADPEAVAKFEACLAKEDDDDKARERAFKILYRVMDRVRDGHFDGEDVKTAEAKVLEALTGAVKKEDQGDVADVFSGLLSAIGKELPHMMTDDDVGQDTEKADWEMSSGVKSKALADAEKIGGAIASMVKALEGAEEKDDATPPLPEPLSQTIEGLAKMIETAIDAYPSPKSGKGNGDADQDDSDGDDQTKKAASPAAVIKDATSILSVVMAKIKPGQPIDEDSYQRLDKLRGLLSSFSKTQSQDSDADQGNGDSDGATKTDKGDEGDEGSVQKAGAKMAAKRRKRFQEALKSLISLFKEIMPESELGKMPHLSVKKSEETDETAAKIAKLEGDLTEARRTINELKSRPTPSNVTTVETTVVKGDKGDKGGDVSWPLDLNAED